jgi:hypothetical protein
VSNKLLQSSTAINVIGGPPPSNINNASPTTEAHWITFILNENQRWEAILVERKLFLQISNDGLPEGSKEAMTELLEYAEETLRVSAVVIAFQKARSDRMPITRTLMYLGFDSLAPNSPLLPADLNNPDLYFMAYTGF